MGADGQNGMPGGRKWRARSTEQRQKTKITEVFTPRVFLRPSRFSPRELVIELFAAAEASAYTRAVHLIREPKTV